MFPGQIADGSSMELEPIGKAWSMRRQTAWKRGLQLLEKDQSAWTEDWLHYQSRNGHFELSDVISHGDRCLGQTDFTFAADSYRIELKRLSRLIGHALRGGMSSQANTITLTHVQDR